MTKHRIKLNLALIIATLLTIFQSSLEPSLAQNGLNLSISPPLLELVLQPGKTYSHEFAITNSGSRISLTPKLLYFMPDGDNGDISITNKVGPSWVSFPSESFVLENGQTKNMTVNFAPPTNTSETDHYLSIIFESVQAQDVLNENAVFYTTQIGSNVLLTISNTGIPTKRSELVEFSAPKLIDSFFGEINYDLVLKNSGNGFWKPNGKIQVNNNITLALAPQNILSGYQRKVSCLDNESLIDCKITKKPLFGIYNASLSYQIDDLGNVYTQTISTLAFPFSLLPIVFMLYLLTHKRIKSHSIKKA